jgi:hypothetical protein
MTIDTLMNCFRVNCPAAGRLQIPAGRQGMTAAMGDAVRRSYRGSLSKRVEEREELEVRLDAKETAQLRVQRDRPDVVFALPHRQRPLPTCSSNSVRQAAALVEREADWLKAEKAGGKFERLRVLQRVDVAPHQLSRARAGAGPLQEPIKTRLRFSDCGASGRDPLSSPTMPCACRFNANKCKAVGGQCSGMEPEHDLCR